MKTLLYVMVSNSWSIWSGVMTSSSRKESGWEEASASMSNALRTSCCTISSFFRREKTEWTPHFNIFIILNTHTHTHTRLILWIVGTFHRLLLLLYGPNYMFYHLPNIFTLLHHLLFFIFCPLKNVNIFKFYYPCGDIWSPQCSINKYRHT